MSPRHQKDHKDIHDSTTEFFLKVVQKEKEKNSRENSPTKENINTTKTKTIDTVGRFYNYINKTLDKILSSKMSIMVLSFIMAGVLFWSIAGSSGGKDNLANPTSGATLDNVPVQIEGLNKSLEISGVPEQVTVGLIGPSLDIYKTNFSKNYEIYLDVKGLSEGEHTINLKSRNFPDTLKVMIVPDLVKIKLSPKEERVYDLGYRFINEDKMDSEYSVSVEEMSLETVILHASQETLDRVAKVEACIDVTDKKESFEQNANIKAYDNSGKEVKVEISPKKVHVKCNVSSYSKSVPIQAHFIGDLSTGYQVSNYTLSQSEVTIYGVEDKIKDIAVVQVDVDVTNLKSNTTISNVSLKKENGINKFSTSAIDVTVEVEKVITKKFDKIPIQVLNNERKYKVSFAGESQYASVSVTGTEAKIASLTADNIQATIDIDKLKLGTNKADVKVAVDDEKLKIELLSSSKVAINIERN